MSTICLDSESSLSWYVYPVAPCLCSFHFLFVPVVQQHHSPGSSTQGCATTLEVCAIIAHVCIQSLYYLHTSVLQGIRT